MKKLFTLVLLLTFGVLQADTIEIKSGEGYRENLRNVQGTFKSRHQSRFPYVCYDKRIKILSQGSYYLSYKGCTRVNVSCKSTGRVHFGKYPNDYKASQALRRCTNARPRFVD